MSSQTQQNLISAIEVRNELGRILESSTFSASTRMCRFLRFTVENALEGNAGTIKESTIGVNVYDRPPNYDRGQDAIVRTEARRLRNKLAEYYASTGKDDPVLIEYRSGSYVPVFRKKDRVESPATAPSSENPAYHQSTKNLGISIAIVPIIDLSGSALSAQCAKGLTEELTHGWVHAPGVRVAAVGAVTSSIQTDGLATLAQKLGVRVISEGSVWEENQRLRVTLRLVHADGFQIWSQRFETHADQQGLFMLTERLASAVISRTRPEGSAAREPGCPLSEARLAAMPTLLSAEALLDEGTTSSLQAAQSKFEALARDHPDSARPFCGVAQCHCIAALRGDSGPKALVAQANQAASRALELDGEMIMAHASLGFVRGLEWRWTEADSHFQKAVALGDHPVAFREYALCLAATKRFDEGDYFLEQAQQIDPFSGRQKVNYAKFFYFARRHEEAWRYFSERSEFGRFPAEAQLYLALAILSDNRHAEAKELALGSRKESGTQPNLMAIIAEIIARCGEVEQAKKMVQGSRLLTTTSPVSLCRRALLSVALGEDEEALSYLRKAHLEREPELVWLKVEPGFDNLRAEPQFAEILTDVMPADGE